MKEFRKRIATEGGSYDTIYTLVRTATGEIYVETFEEPNKPFQRASQGPTIRPDAFDKHIIDGRSSREIVEEAIRRKDSEAE